MQATRVVALAVLLMPGMVSGQEPTPAGAEFQVNAYTSGDRSA